MEVSAPSLQKIKYQVWESMEIMLTLVMQVLIKTELHGFKWRCSKVNQLPDKNQVH